MDSQNTPDHPRLHLRIIFDEARFLGPGKIALLQGIAVTGSIAAAGRDMGMSYKRAWDLVAAMNGIFAAPLVVSSRGGAKGGGAHLTEMGAQVVALYQRFQAQSLQAGAGELAALTALLRDGLGEK